MFKFVNNSQISPWQSETLMLKNRSSLCIGFSSNYGMKIRQYVLFKIKNSPSRKLHWERNHSFYSENVWGSIEVRSLRFASSVMGTQTFFLSFARDKTKRHLSLFLYWAQNLTSLLLYFKTVYILHNMDLRRVHAQDLRGSFRVDVFDSKEDYQDNLDETLKVEKCFKWLVPSRLYFAKESY